MSTDNAFETWVRSQLARIAAPVTARPDPYDRLVRRRRFGWLRGGLVGAAAALAAAATGSIIALSPAGSPVPAPPPAREAWIASLLDAPPRGAVAADRAFRQDLSDRVAAVARERRGPWELPPHRDNAARVLFADDIAGQRIAIVAVLPPPDADLDLPHQVVWLAGPAGATPAHLVSPLTGDPATGVRQGTAPVTPFLLAFVGVPAPSGSGCAVEDASCTLVALAPPGCGVSTSPSDDRIGWTPEQTGSYSVRTVATRRDEYWRVTCGGVVREERAVPRLSIPPVESVPAQDIDQGVAVVAGMPAEDDPFYPALRSQIAESLWQVGTVDVALTGQPRVLWGQVLDSDPLSSFETPDAKTLMVATAVPTKRATWVVGFSYSHVSADGPTDGGMAFQRITADRLDAGPDTMLAIDLGWWGHGPHWVAVVTPLEAATVRLRTAGGADLPVMALDLAAGDHAPPPSAQPSGTTATRVPVSDRLALLSLPDGTDPAGLWVEAFDATGRRLASTPLLADNDIEDRIDAWDS